MHRTMLTLVVLAALSCTAQAFLQDLLNLHHSSQPQYAPHYAPQYQPQYQYQYRRAAYEPQPQPQQPVQYGYVYSRPAFYQQWLPGGARPTSYESGTAYSYASNPISSFLQGSWLPWSGSNRQPIQQQQQPQQLSAQLVSSQPQQPQQPQPAIWGFLPWSGSQQTGSNGNNPVLSWLQHPLQLPWGQQQQQQQPVYTTPLAPAAPAAAPALSTLHVVTAEAPVAAPVLSQQQQQLPSAAAVIKPEGVVLEDTQFQQLPAISNNAIRRLTLEHADGQPCA